MRKSTFTEEDIKYIRYFYPNHTLKWVAKKLNRSEGSVHAQAQQLGIKKREPARPWTEEELQILRQDYPVKGTRTVIPGRSAQTIAAMAAKHQIYRLRDDRPLKNPWTEGELQILKEDYPVHGSTFDLPDRTKSEIHQMAYRLGLKKIWTRDDGLEYHEPPPPKPKQPTPVLDRINAMFTIPKL